MRTRITVAALAAAALFAGAAQATVPLPVPAAVPAPSAPDALLRDAATIAAKTGLPLALVQREVAVQGAVGELQERVANRWPDTFGGLWIDQPTGLVHVAFTRDAAANVAAVAGTFSAPELLVPVTVGRSYRALKAVQERMIADRGDGRAWPGMTGTRYAIDVDQRQNRLVVVTDGHTAETVAALRAAYGDVRVDATGNGSPHACTPTDCRWYLRSGLATGSSTSANCSTGFSAAWNGTFTLTAGHCTSSVGWHGGNLYSTSSGWTHVNGGNVDAGKLALSSDSFKAGPWIRVDVNELARKVTSVQFYSQLTVGQWICKSGWRTLYTCGSVLSRDYSVPASFPTPAHTNFMLTDMCDQQGDSGAGIYIGNQAVGLISGGNSNSGCSSSYRGWHGHIQHAAAALNVTVLTSTTPPTFTAVSAAQAIATTGTVKVTFSKPVKCLTVDHIDFTVTVQGRVDYPVASTSCTEDSNQTVLLTVTRPLVQGMSVSVRLDPNAIQDPAGGQVSGTTRSTTVTGSAL